MKLKNKAVLLALALAITSPAVANAKTNVTGGPFTNLQTTGQVIHLALTGYPANSGFYIQQCLHQENWDRPMVCNPAAQLWISNSVGANFAPNADIIFKPTATYSVGGKTVDCTRDICGIYIRLDHTATADDSEDQFIPLAFVGGISPTVHEDQIKVTINKKVIGSSSTYRAKYKEVLTLVTSTKSGLPTTITSLSPACTISGSTVTVQKGGGYCDIAITSQGNSQYLGVTRHLLLKLYPGVQKVNAQTTGTAGSTITLPSTTNFGEKVSYVLSNTANCSLNIYALTLKKAGDCTVRANAPGLIDTYSSLRQTISINIK